jgi:hypothetical protein
MKLPVQVVCIWFKADQEPTELVDQPHADSDDGGQVIRRKAAGCSDARRTVDPGIPARAVVGG